MAKTFGTRTEPTVLLVVSLLYPPPPPPPLPQHKVGPRQLIR